MYVCVCILLHGLTTRIEKYENKPDDADKKILRQVPLN